MAVLFQKVLPAGHNAGRVIIKNPYHVDEEKKSRMITSTALVAAKSLHALENQYSKVEAYVAFLSIPTGIWNLVFILINDLFSKNYLRNYRSFFLFCLHELHYLTYVNFVLNVYEY